MRIKQNACTQDAANDIAVCGKCDEPGPVARQQIATYGVRDAPPPPARVENDITEIPSFL